MEAVGLKEFLLEQRDKEDFSLYLYFLSLCYSRALRKALFKHSSLVSSYSTDEERKAHVSTLGPESETGGKHCLHLRRLAQYWQLFLGEMVMVKVNSGDKCGGYIIQLPYPHSNVKIFSFPESLKHLHTVLFYLKRH